MNIDNLEVDSGDNKFDLAIVDADSILYRLALKAEQIQYVTSDDKVFESHEDAINYCYKHGEDLVDTRRIETATLVDLVKDVYSRLSDIREDTKSKNLIAYIGGPKGKSDGNFRKKIGRIKPYKGNRKGKEEPSKLQPLKELLYQTKHDDKPIAILAAPGYMEADDSVIIDLIRYQRELGENRVVLCAVDKDALQVQGFHYNFDKNTLDYIDDHKANVNFYTQLLIGDSADNILGLFGVGKANKLVKDLVTYDTEQEMFDSVYIQYKKRFGNYADKFIMENFRLLYMLREGDVGESYSKCYSLINQGKLLK